MTTLKTCLRRPLSLAYAFLFFSTLALSIPAVASEVSEDAPTIEDADTETLFRTQLELYRLNNLIEQDGDNADYYYNRGCIFEQLNDPAKAVKDYSAAIDINSEHTDALYNRGLIYLNDGKYELAIEDFSEVIRINPESADALCNRGYAYYTLEKTKNALQDFTSAIELTPDDPDLYYSRALIYLKMKKKKKAMEDMREAARLGNPQAREYLDRSGSIL